MRTRPDIKSTLEPDWNHWNFGAANQQRNAPLKRRNGAVVAAAALWINQQATPLRQNLQRGLDCRGVGFFFQRNGVEGTDQRTKPFIVEQRAARDVGGLTVIGHGRVRNWIKK